MSCELIMHGVVRSCSACMANYRIAPNFVVQKICENLSSLLKLIFVIHAL